MTSPASRALRSLLVAALAVLTTALAGSASAEAPVDVTGPVTDSANVLGDRADEVREALDGLFDNTGQQLFVVYVDSFDGLDGQAWADRSAAESDLGDNDILLAVATVDRAYGFSVDDDSKLSDRDLRSVEDDDLLPALRDEDWAGAAIAAARGYDDALNPGPPWTLIGLAGAAVIGGGTVVAVRARRRRQAGEPDEDLQRRSGSALVAIDDALRSADQELAYAEAQFGQPATTTFIAALAEARTHAAAAFELRQRLDDSQPETGPERDQMARQIVDLCAQADALLDEQVEAFTQLRDLQAKAPEVLAATAERARDITERLPTSRAVFDGLQATHPASDLVSVAGNVSQAEKLAAEALRQTELGTAAVTDDDRATAVVHARTAEESVAQATLMLDALDRADADLAAAPGLIAERLTSLNADLADAAALAPDDPAVTTGTTNARAAIAAADAPDHDPLAAIRGLQAAEATLDELLVAPRAEAEKAETARLALAGAVEGARARVTAVDDYIQTRRGVVGLEARTRLSEGTRQLQVAVDLQPTDPVGAMSTVSRALDLLGQAERLAQADVAAWERQQQPDAGGGILGGIFSGSSTGGRSGRRRSGGSSTRSRSSSSRRSSSRSSSRRSGGRRGGGGRF